MNYFSKKEDVKRVERIMNFRIIKSTNIKRLVSILIALLLSTQLIAVFGVVSVFADEGNPPENAAEMDGDNITYTDSRTLTGQEANDYIASWKNENADIVNPDLNDPDVEPAEAAVIPWAKGKYGEYRLVTQTIRYITVEDGVELFKPVKRRVIFLGMTISGGVPNMVPSLEVPTAKVTRYIDEDGNTVKEAGVFGFLAADQYIYDADGKIIYVFKETLPDTEDVRTHVYAKYMAPVRPTHGTHVTPKPETPKVKKLSKASSVTPRTYDSTDIVFYSGLLGTSILSVILMIVRRRMKHGE
mgnify:FL=1